jgi:hypothetical protein
VQKLIAQNENRVLLKFEKQKCKELEDKLESLKQENQKLKDDLTYKLSVYAAYLPEAILADAVKKKMADPTDPNRKKLFEYGQDPITIRDQMISDRDSEILEKVKEIEILKTLQEREFVPRVTKEKIEENLMILQVFHASLSRKNSWSMWKRMKSWKKC